MARTEEQVRELIDAGKCKQAVELAKTFHKQSQTEQSRQLLFQAYLARIAQLQSKGMGPEAQTLIMLVRERFPQERAQLASLEMRALADAGKIDELLRPLGSEQTSTEVRTAIEALLANHITDLPAVAACASLPADHPLRRGASAAWTAFSAAVARPVSDEEISLPEISRRSPFAPWKMLVRAIAAFYRSNDEDSLRALELIPTESAVTPMAKVLRSLIERMKPPTGAAAALYNRVLVDDEPLRSALMKIESALRFTDPGMLIASIRESVRLCTSTRPELLERLRQHISVACMIEQAPVRTVVSALGSTIKDAYFWRLSAVAQEAIAPAPVAALQWQRFMAHAIAEKMFAPDSLEVAMIWLHIADLLSPVSIDAIERFGDRVGESNYISSYYTDQSTEIARLRPSSDRELADFVLTPGRGFEQAARIRPDSQTFTNWMAWAQRSQLPVKEQEQIAAAWHKAREQDVQPLLILSSLAEDRKAFSTAIKHVADAERIDPMSQQVRQARVRLTLSITWRHFSEGKAHLVEKDLTELAALPAMTEGDRAAVLESIRGAWHQMRGDAAGENACFQIAGDRLGFLCASVVFNSVKKMAKLTPTDLLATPQTPSQPLEIAQAQATAIRLGVDLKLKIQLPKPWTAIVKQVLRQRPCPISNPDLLLLGRGGLLAPDMETAYLASSAGLIRANTPAAIAKFLLLRAKSLSERWHRPRTLQCLRAALQLARQAHDQDLINEIFTAVDSDRILQRTISDSRDGKGITDEAVQQVVKSETAAEAWPRDEDDIESVVVPEAIPEPRRRFAGFEDEDEGEEYWDDQDDEDQDGFFDTFDSGSDPEEYADNPFPELNQQQMAELMAAAGASNPDDAVSSPTKLIAALAKMMGKKLGEADIQELVRQMSQSLGPGSANRQSAQNSKQKKRKKRR